jgi:hypothetical protein
VLVCPDCQVPGWTEGLDVCPGCGSTMLVKQLGVVSCRACGRERDECGADGVRREPAPDGALPAEVAAALERVLGRAPGAATDD